MAASKSAVKAAEEIDATIFDYDSFHDAKSTVLEAKKEATRQDAIDRKPKYINNLLDAAARRKQDQQIAREKQLQRERENEGDEFADKETFVTGAYKQQQEETRRLEEEEKNVVVGKFVIELEDVDYVDGVWFEWGHLVVFARDEEGKGCCLCKNLDYRRVSY